ncbi:ArnT family glycosyltransferase [Saccharothrix hoggarensis]|uniref:ArnT family glycosyltransferase n=1 Tax=Saccharothrix hoggarensis TaxID=913853 RepID=A0ABW3R4L6_9PSEU
MASVTHHPPLAVPRPAGPEPRAAAGGKNRDHVRGAGLILLGICALAGVLYTWAIGASDFGNAYYSAAIRSMTESLPNFLFGAADPYGVVNAAKPPMALWPQAVFASVFGFHSWALMLPQVIEGVATVVLLHRTVRLWAGERVALVAALILALTPVTVMVNRSNNTDTLLVLLLVAAAYAFTRAVHSDAARSQVRWLLLCAFLIGCGFTTKLMAAWVIVPGLALVYLVCVDGPVRRRVNHLLAAGGVLAVSSLWWPVLLDVWPGRKPYMGASLDGTALDNIIGYNGFGKIFNLGQQYGGSGLHVQLGAVGMGGGYPDVTRMFVLEVGGQISWLLPFSLLVLAVVGAAGYRRLWFRVPGNRLQRAGWLLWSTWLVVTILVFSFTEGIWHPYYTTALAPPIAAISAAGLSLLWRTYRTGRGRGWLLLPASVALTGAWAVVLIDRDPSWQGWTKWVVIAATLVSVVGLVLGSRSSAQRRTVGRSAFLLGVVAMLFTPAVWSVVSAAEHKTNGGFPSAGPPNEALNALTRGELPAGAVIPGFEHVEPAPPRAGGFAGAVLHEENRKVLEYAERNSDGAAITLAVEGGGLAASSFIIDSDAMLVSMGGYLGADAAPSVDQLRRWVDDGALRYVLTAAPGEKRMGGIAGMGGEEQRERVEWVQDNCAPVDPAVYGGAPITPAEDMLPLPGYGDAMLYRCG